jgi:hypothetical protein
MAIGSVCALVFLLVNLGVIVSPLVEKISKRPLLPLPLFNAFCLFGVFSYYELENSELTIWGCTQRSETDDPVWKQLPSSDYFPFGRGEQSSRMWASHHHRDLTRQGHWRTWQAVGRKIMERYNREHPSEPLIKVAFQNKQWPRSPDGYYHSEADGRESRQFWVVAERGESSTIPDVLPNAPSR